MPNTREISKTILIRESPEKVFAALTEAADLDAWWGESDEVASDRGDFGASIWRSSERATLQVQEARPHRYLRLSWSLNANTGPARTAKVAIDLQPTGNGTLVTVTHGGIPTHASWSSIAESIAHFWVARLVYLLQWVESGRRRAEIDDPTRFATIDKSIPVSASVDAVFEVLVDPAMLAKWLHARVSIDARVGGRMDVLWSGGEHVGGEIVLFDQPHHVVWHWWDADKLESEDDPGMITVMTWSLKKVGGQTELTIVDRGYDREQADDQYMAEIEKDWDTFLKSIPIALDRI